MTIFYTLHDEAIVDPAEFSIYGYELRQFSADNRYSWLQWEIRRRAWLGLPPLESILLISALVMFAFGTSMWA